MTSSAGPPASTSAQGAHAAQVTGSAVAASQAAPSSSAESPPGPPGAPPTYAPIQPQMLVLPLPDAPGFFWGRTLQGEVFVKGLGEARTRSVQSLTVTARLTDSLPGQADVEPIQLPVQTLYASGEAASSATLDHPFPASHRFTIPLPASLPDGGVLPAAQELGQFGALRWTIRVRLALISGQVLTETVNVEGAPPDLVADDDLLPAESVLERDGVRVRLLLACSRPRLGDPLRIGVEVRPKKPARATLAELAAQPDPDESLRPLRRVRVELLRLVDTPSGTQTSVIHSTGKSLRYPGKSQPPLRVLFTLSTAPLHLGPLAPGGEISARTPYHTVRFAVRATLGFGSIGDATGPGSTDPARDWCVEEKVIVRPGLWREPVAVVIERGVLPRPGSGDGVDDSEEAAREAYRRKGQDTVGAGGTFRQDDSDLPPPFTDAADTAAGPSSGPSALPSFNESEAQMRSGEAPLVANAVPSQVLQPVDFSDPCPDVPRRSSLTGELGTWIEYDGYERFSAPPPPAAASFGLESSMDPPREGDDDNGDVVGSMVARLGLPSGSAPNPEELMEQLGLGQGTRVVDLQDDLPPGIDEPSLPALPGFDTPLSTASMQASMHSMHQHSQQLQQQLQYHAHTHGTHPPNTHPRTHALDGADHPPSFDASEAAEAVGGVARSRVGSVTGPPEQDAPPGYFGGGPPAYS